MDYANEDAAQTLLNFCENKDLHTKKVNAQDFVFEETVKMNCFYCEKYNHNWRCPPRLPPVDYTKLFKENDNIFFVYQSFRFTEDDFRSVRIDSTNIIHKSLLELEKELFQHGVPHVISFIGGSCKLCKNGCAPDRCKNPSLARVPLEATSMNIVKTAAKYDIAIKWPVKNELIRLGLIMW